MRNEWSLIFFTLFIQFAVGMFVIITTLNSYALLKTNLILPKEIVSRLIWIVIAVSVIALISSFLHLGRPRNALLALSNLGTSWLSREILSVILFVLTLGIYSFLSLGLEISDKVTIGVSIVGSVFGLIAIFSMSKIYMLETVPAWNSFHTIVQFFTTALVFGILGLILILFNNEFVIKHFRESVNITDIGLKIILVIISFNLILFLIKLYYLNTDGIAAQGSFNIITVENMTLFYVRLILSLSAIALILFQLYYIKSEPTYFLLISISAVIILSEIVGRYLFYASYNRVGI